MWVCVSLEGCGSKSRRQLLFLLIAMQQRDVSPCRSRSRSRNIESYRGGFALDRREIPACVLVCLFCGALATTTPAVDRDLCIMCRRPCVRYYCEGATHIQRRVNQHAHNGLDSTDFVPSGHMRSLHPRRPVGFLESRSFQHVPGNPQSTTIRER